MKLLREKALTLARNMFYNTNRGTGSIRRAYRLGMTMKSVSRSIYIFLDKIGTGSYCRDVIFFERKRNRFLC
jgi:hypothetical protein